MIHQDIHAEQHYVRIVGIFPGCTMSQETLLRIRTKQINKQVRMPSSQMIFRKRGMNVTQWLAEGESITGTNSMNAGGPGDRRHALQISIHAGIKGNKLRAGNYGKNGSQRVTGEDRKHSSYARYLARRVGKVLRQETSSIVTGRTASVGQPINRTLTKATYALQARRTTGNSYCFIP